MKKIFVKASLLLLLLQPMHSFAAGLTGTLNAYSVKEKRLTVNQQIYWVDLENLNITYDGESVGMDPLRPGLRVRVIFSENEKQQGQGEIIQLEIITRIPGMES